MLGGAIMATVTVFIVNSPGLELGFLRGFRSWR